jgi:hypothetical protein
MDQIPYSVIPIWSHLHDAENRQINGLVTNAKGQFPESSKYIKTRSPEIDAVTLHL